MEVLKTVEWLEDHNGNAGAVDSSESLVAGARPLQQSASNTAFVELDSSADDVVDGSSRRGQSMAAARRNRNFRGQADELEEGERTVSVSDLEVIDQDQQSGERIAARPAMNNSPVEQLKPLESFDFPIDFSQSYSVSGHSTGARVALMLAALKDTNFRYLADTKFPPNFRKRTNSTSNSSIRRSSSTSTASVHNTSTTSSFADLITPRMKKILTEKTVAFVADHPDPMEEESLNPDVKHYDITHSPVFLITGSEDTTFEPVGSCWRDFEQISTPSKVFLDVFGDGHLEPNLGGRHEGPYMAYFLRWHVLRDENAWAKIYGPGVDAHGKKDPIALVNRKDFVAPEGSKNNGGKRHEIGFLACSRGKWGEEIALSVPAGEQAKKYCPRSEDMTNVDAKDVVDVLTTVVTPVAPVV